MSKAEDYADIARMFCDPNGTVDGRDCVHARAGELAATDGRVLIHVDDPSITGVCGPHDGIINYAVEEGERVAGPKQITKLFKALKPALKVSRDEFAKLRNEFEGNPRKYFSKEDGVIRYCPCCEKEVILKKGYLFSFAEWVEKYRPGPDNMLGAAIMHTPLRERPYVVTLRYMDVIATAVARLGDVDRLCVLSGIDRLVFHGPNWHIVAACVIPTTPGFMVEAYDTVFTFEKE